MNALYKFFRKHYYLCYTILFLFTSLLYFSVFIAEGKSLIRFVDGLEQQYNFFVYEGKWLRQIVRTLLHDGQLIIPMWDTSIGYGSDIIVTAGSFFGDSLYLISGIIPSRFAEVGFTLVELTRLFLSGLFFSFFSFRHHNSKLGTLVGSLLYAFSGWMLLTSSQSGLISPAIWLPLLLLGVDRILNGESPLLLIGSTAALFFNYFYFGYMACILLPMYAAVFICFPDDGLRIKERKAEYYIPLLKRTAFAACCFVLGIVISSMMLLPSMAAMLSQVGEGRLGLERYSPLLYELPYYPKFLVGLISFTNVGPDSMMGCGALALPAIVLLALQRHKDRALRVALVVLTACMLIPFAGRVFNGMGYVTNRWAFAYALCLSFVVARKLGDFYCVTQKESTVLLLVVVAVGLTIMLFPNTKSVEAFAGLSIVAAFVTYVILGSKVDSNRLIYKRTYILIAFTILSVYVPSFFYFSTQVTQQVNSGEAWKTLTKTETYRAMSKEKEMDTSLYRYSYGFVSQIRNADMIFDHNSFNSYLSVYDNNVNLFENKLELATSSLPHQISGPSGSAYLYSAFGTKYYVLPVGKENYLPYGFSHVPKTTITIKGVEVGVYENRLALPLAYCLSSTMPYEAFDNLSPIQKRQSLLQAVATEDGNMGESRNDYEDSVLKPTNIECGEGAEYRDGQIIVTKQNATIDFEVESDAECELYCEIRNMSFIGVPPQEPNKWTLPKLVDHLEALFYWTDPAYYGITVQSDQDISAVFSGQTYRSHMYGGKNSSLMSLGYADEPVRRVTLTFDSVGTYTFDRISVIQQRVENLERFVDEIRKSWSEVNEMPNGYGVTLESVEDQQLFLSVPWSTGWSATIDGKPVEVQRANIAFMSIRVPQGRHEITFSYQTPWLKLGAIISLCGIAVAIVVVLVYRYMKRRAVDNNDPVDTNEWAC